MVPEVAAQVGRGEITLSDAVKIVEKAKPEESRKRTNAFSENGKEEKQRQGKATKPAKPGNQSFENNENSYMKLFLDSASAMLTNIGRQRAVSRKRGTRGCSERKRATDRLSTK